jgi:hypothetical protein
MRSKTITLYQFAELPTEAAKEKVREWMRQCEGEFFDPEMEPVETAAKLLGIDLDSRQTGTNRKTGKAIYKPAIYYRLAYCQGDGAGFEGTYQHIVSPKNILLRVKQEFPTDKVLHGIASELAGLQRKYGYKIVARIKERNDYMYFDSVELDDSEREFALEDQNALGEVFRSFGSWIYDFVRAEYEYRTSDEALDETMEANEYEFTEDGERA